VGWDSLFASLFGLHVSKGHGEQKDQEQSRVTRLGEFSPNLVDGFLCFFLEKKLAYFFSR
jgi:hypothetical protein